MEHKARVTQVRSDIDIPHVITNKPEDSLDTGAGHIMFQENELVFGIRIDGTVTMTGDKDDKYVVSHNGEVKDPWEGTFVLSEDDVIVVVENKQRGIQETVTYTIDTITIAVDFVADMADSEATDDDTTDDSGNEVADVEDDGATDDSEDDAETDEADVTPERPELGPQEICLHLKRGNRTRKVYVPADGQIYRLGYPFHQYVVMGYPDIANQCTVSYRGPHSADKSDNTHWHWSTNRQYWKVRSMYHSVPWLKPEDEVRSEVGVIRFIDRQPLRRNTARKLYWQRRWHNALGLISQHWLNVVLGLLALFFLIHAVFFVTNRRYRANADINFGSVLYNAGIITQSVGKGLEHRGEVIFSSGYWTIQALDEEDTNEETALPPTVTPLPTLTPTVTPTATPTATLVPPFDTLEVESDGVNVQIGQTAVVSGNIPAETEFTLVKDGFSEPLAVAPVDLNVFRFATDDLSPGEYMLIASYNGTFVETPINVVSQWGCPIFTDPGPGRFTLKYWVNVPYGEDGVPLTLTEGHLFTCHMRETDPYIVYFNPEAGTVSFDSRQRLVPVGNGVENFVVQLVFELDVAEGTYDFRLDHDDGVEVEIRDSGNNSQMYFYRDWEIGATHFDSAFEVSEGTENVSVSIKLFEWDNRGLSKLIFTCPTCWQQPEVEEVEPTPPTAVPQDTNQTTATQSFGEMSIESVDVRDASGKYQVTVYTTPYAFDGQAKWFHVWAEGCPNGSGRVNGTAERSSTLYLYFSPEVFGSCTLVVELRSSNDSSYHLYDRFTQPIMMPQGAGEQNTLPFPP